WPRSPRWPLPVGRHRSPDRPSPCPRPPPSLLGRLAASSRPPHVRANRPPTLQAYGLLTAEHQSLSGRRISLGALVVRGDLEQYPLALDGRAVGAAHVLLAELVDVGARHVASHLLDDTAAHLDVVVRVVGVEHGHGDPRVPHHVLVPLPVDL